MFSDIVCTITESVQKPKSDKTNTIESKCRSAVPYLVLSEGVIFLGFTSFKLKNSRKMETFAVSSHSVQQFCSCISVT